MKYFHIEITRQEFLYSAIRERRKSGRPLELIIGTEHRDEVVRNLERLGSVTHNYRLIPYAAVLCSPEDASLLVSRRYSDFRNISIELSNDISLPSPKIRKARADYWHLDAIGAYRARQISPGNAKIGIIDTGAEFSHPEIGKNLRGGHNFVSPTEPADDNGHGTHVAGLISGIGCGVAQGAELYALKILDRRGSGSEANAIAAVEWAVLNGLDLVNMSFGSRIGSAAFQRMINVASGKGLSMVAAAGNDGGYYASYPAAFENVIAVAAVDKNLQHAEFSNIFPANDISAPGVGITSSYLNGTYAVLDGTSMACPLVTGSLALIRGNLEQILKETASPLHWDGDYGDSEVFGAGLVRADRMAERMEKYSARRLLEFAGKVLW